MRSIRMRMLTYADVCVGADSFIYYSTPSVKGSPTLIIDFAAVGSAPANRRKGYLPQVP